MSDDDEIIEFRCPCAGNVCDGVRQISRRNLGRIMRAVMLRMGMVNVSIDLSRLDFKGLDLTVDLDAATVARLAGAAELIDGPYGGPFAHGSSGPHHRSGGAP